MKHIIKGYSHTKEHARTNPIRRLARGTGTRHARSLAWVGFWVLLCLGVIIKHTQSNAANGSYAASADPAWFESNATMEEITNEVKRLGIDRIDIPENDKPGFTGLMHFASRSRYEPFRYFLDFGARVNVKPTNESLNTPLHLTSLNGNYTEQGAVPEKDRDVRSFVEDLIEAGADVSARNRLMETPLHLASQIHDYKTQLDVIDMLLKNGADINAQNADGFTLLHKLVSNYGTVMIRDYLLKSPWRIIIDYNLVGLSRNIIRTPLGDNPVCQMDASGSTANCPVIKVTPQQFADELGFEGAALIAPQQAIKEMNQRSQRFKERLTKFIPLTTTLNEKYKDTSVGQAVSIPFAELLNGPSELTLVMLGVIGRFPALFEKIIDDVTLCDGKYLERKSHDQYEYNALHFAVLHGQIAMAQKLLDKARALHVDLVNARDKHGRTPLLKIPFLSDTNTSPALSVQFLTLLAKYGARMDAVGNDGNTILHLLILFDKGPLLYEISKNAALKAAFTPLLAVRNRLNETPQDVARRLKRQYLLDPLVK